MPALKPTRAEKIGRRFKAAMCEKGYTQTRLAKLLGIKQSTMSSWVNRSDVMQLKDFRLLCKALDLDPAEIIAIE